MSGAEIVVLTGASAGVGRATAREFARHGATLALLARGREGLDAAAREVEALGGRALAIPTDVSRAADVAAAAEKVERDLGPIDIWINDAMTTIFAPIWEIQPEEYRRVTDVTYHGAVYGTMTALEHMLPRDRGMIVQVGSALSHRAIPLQSAYCGAKHALRAFTDSLRTELIHHERAIGVTMVQLPGLNTPQFSWSRSRMPRKPQPLPPVFQPEVAARAIYWAAHHGRRELYVGFPTLKTVWGQKLAPGVVDRYLGHKGYDGQMTKEPERQRPGNLFEPVPGDFGAHGRYDERSHPRSPLTWVNERGGNAALRAAGAVAAAGALALVAKAIANRWS